VLRAAAQVMAVHVVAVHVVAAMLSAGSCPRRTADGAGRERCTPRWLWGLAWGEYH